MKTDVVDPGIEGAHGEIEIAEMGLGQNEIQSYLDQGFLVKPSVIGEETLNELKAEIEKIANGVYPSPSFPVVSGDEAKGVFQNILCVHQPQWISPYIRSFLSHPALTQVLRQVVAAHLPWWDGRVKCMQSMFFVKPPTFPGQAWHQDEIYIPTRDRSLTGAWVAVDGATVENGCLWVIPGSHQKGLLYPQRPHGNSDEFDSSLESFGFSDAQEIPVEVPPGSVVFFNGYLLHRSKKNRSRGYRRAIVNHYMSAQSFLPWGPASSGEPVATLDNRRIIPVWGPDPYPEKGLLTGNDAHLRRVK